ncbi:MAG: DUF3352 domain-containing protein [Spirulinaceae cyanobacterium]
MVKKKFRRFLLPTLGTAILLGSGTAIYWLLVRPYFFAAQKLTGAELVPQEVIFAASISTDEEQWQQLQQLGTKGSQQRIKKYFSELSNTFLQANGYSYETHIQPWVGEEITVAYLPPTQSALIVPNASPSEDLAKPMVFILPMENPVQAGQLLDSPNSDLESKKLRRTYKGVEIEEIQNSQSQRYSLTIIKSFLVIANNSQAMEKVIDSYQEKTSLEADSSYQKALRQLGKKVDFARFYGHFPTIVATAKTNSLAPAPESTTQYRQGVTGSLSLTPESLHWEGIIWGKPGEFMQPVNSFGNYLTQFKEKSLASHLPQQTLFFFAGQNLPTQWQGWDSEAELLPLLPFGEETIANVIQENTGMSWQEDFLPWLGEDFAFALTPITEDNLINFTDRGGVKLGAALITVAQTQNRASGEKALQQLDEAMGTRYQFQVKSAQQGGQPVVNWTSPLGGIEAVRGWLSKDVFFFSLGAPISNKILPKPKRNLSSNQLFKQVVKKGFAPVNSELFFDVENFMAKKGTLAFPEGQKDLLNGVRAFGITTTVIDSQSTRFEATFLLQNNSPNPNPSNSSPEDSEPKSSPFLDTSPGDGELGK